MGLGNPLETANVVDWKFSSFHLAQSKIGRNLGYIKSFTDYGDAKTVRNFEVHYKIKKKILKTYINTKQVTYLESIG